MSLDLDPIVIWRDFVTDGIPASGPHEPRKVEIRQSLSAMRQAVIALLADADPELELPNLLIRATDAGSGTPNAIQATTNLPVPPGDAASLIALNIFETNTGSPVTVSLNGGSALTIKTNSGNDVVAGGLVEGMICLGMKFGSTFRLLSDQVSAAIVAAAEAAAAEAEGYAAGLNLPPIETGDAGKKLAVTAEEDGYELVEDSGGKFDGPINAGFIGTIQAAFDESLDPSTVYFAGASAETVIAPDGSFLELDASADFTGTIVGRPVQKKNRFSWGGDYEGSQGYLAHWTDRWENAANSDRNALAIFRGTATNPDAATKYAETALFVELHTSSALDAAQSVWGNEKKVGAIVGEARAWSGAEVELNGGVFRAYSTESPIDTGGQGSVLVGMSCLAQSNTPTSTAAWDVFGANIIANVTAGDLPQNIVGIEVDITHGASGTGATNYTAYWAQSAAFNSSISDYALLITRTGESGGWRGAIKGISSFHDWMIDLRTDVNDVSARGLRIETAYASVDGKIISALTQGVENFVVTGDSVNPVFIRMGGTLRPVHVGNPDSAAPGFRLLATPN